MNKNLICRLSNGGSEYSIDTWKYWCDKNNIDFINIDSLQNLYENEYDKIGIVSSNTMIKWDTPNIFDYFNSDEFCGVVDDINFKKIYKDIKNYNKDSISASNYISGDVLFFGKKYLNIIREVTSEVELNYYLQKHNIKVKVLAPEWNLMGLEVRQFFSYNWQLKEDNTPFFVKYGKIWNFGSNNVSMGKVWNFFVGKYK